MHAADCDIAEVTSAENADTIVDKLKVVGLTPVQ